MKRLLRIAVISLAMSFSWSGFAADGGPDIKGKVVCTASLDKMKYLVTDAGEIASTKDGITWKTFDFNENYAGYYGHVDFSCICMSGLNILAAGTYEDGRPAVFVSTRGTVWSERSLTYKINGQTYELEAAPLGAAYDASLDRYVLECTDGIYFVLPNCSHCNQIGFQMTEDISRLSFNRKRE